MMTVLALMAVRPFSSVATQSMVSVATSLVSITMFDTSMPLRKVVMPRSVSPACPGPVSLTVAPRSRSCRRR